MDGVSYVVLIYLSGVVTGLLIPALLRWLAMSKKEKARRDDRGHDRESRYRGDSRRSDRRSRRLRGRAWWE